MKFPMFHLSQNQRLLGNLFLDIKHDSTNRMEQNRIMEANDFMKDRIFELWRDMLRHE